MTDRPAPVELAVRAAKGALRRTYPHSLALVTGRWELPELLNRRGLLGTGVEVGVDRGDFSELILKSWSGRRLISVDSWLAEPGHAERQAEVDRRFADATERLGAFGERSEIWRRDSVEAAEKVEARSLDFVYIDAAHDYESVRRDIEAWAGRVRPGGILSGHDYWDGPHPYDGAIYGVRRAVNEFCAQRGLRVRTTWRENPLDRSWLVRVR
jgi:hypothetical protein